MTAPSRYEAGIATEQLSDSVDVDTFKSAFRMHPAGVAVLTADSGERPAAMTVSSLASVSTEPPMVTFSLSALSGPTATFLQSDTVVIHLLRAEQLWLAQLGAAPGVDRFADTTRWRRLPSGEPVFPDTYSWLRGRIVHRLEAGNSIVCVAHIVEASVPELEAPESATSGALVYHARTWHQLSAVSSL